MSVKNKKLLLPLLALLLALLTACGEGVDVGVIGGADGPTVTITTGPDTEGADENAGETGDLAALQYAGEPYAVINGNNATLVDLIPNVDGLYVEAADSEAAKAYVNIVVVKPENADAEWVKALEQVIYTQKVYDLIVEAGFAPTFTVK